MDIETVKKEEMEALKSLAETNIKVSNVKNTLAKLELDEGAYIKKREKDTLKAIEKVVTESRKVLGEAYENYNAVHTLVRSSSEFAEFLDEAYHNFLDLKKTFEESTEAWQDHVKAIERGLEEIKKEVKLDKATIKRETQALDKRKKAMVIEKHKLVDERQTLERAIIRLKKKRV